MFEDLHLGVDEVCENVISDNFWVSLFRATDADSDSSELFGASKIIADAFETVMATETDTWCDNFGDTGLSFKAVMQYD